MEREKRRRQRKTRGRVERRKIEAGKEKYKENWEMEEVGWKGEKEEEEAGEAAEWEPGRRKNNARRLRLKDFWVCEDTQEGSCNQPGAGRRTCR